MKILVVGDKLDRVEEALFCGLHEQGIQISILSGGHTQRLRDRGITVQEHAFRNRFDLSGIKRIRTWCNREDFNIVHTLSARALSTSLLAGVRRRSRVVAYRGTVGHLSRIDPSSYLSFLHPGVAGISCVSEAVRNYLQSKGLPSNRLFTIYKGHDTSWYESPASTMPSIPEGSFVIACTANVRPVKGVDVLLQAVGNLAAYPTIHVILLGHERDDSLQRLAERLSISERVHRLGFVSEPWRYVRGADLFVMPSRAREGLPKALLEAMSVGTPAIGSSVGGIPEVIEDRVSGLLVPGGDSTALAEAIRLSITDPAAARLRSERAFYRITNIFSVPQMIKKTMAMYESVLGDRPTQL